MFVSNTRCCCCNNRMRRCDFIRQEEKRMKSRFFCCTTNNAMTDGSHTSGKSRFCAFLCFVFPNGNKTYAFCKFKAVHVPEEAEHRHCLSLFSRLQAVILREAEETFNFWNSPTVFIFCLVFVSFSCHLAARLHRLFPRRQRRLPRRRQRPANSFHLAFFREEK